jgi:hypothetical protein
MGPAENDASIILYPHIVDPAIAIAIEGGLR